MTVMTNAGDGLPDARRTSRIALAIRLAVIVAVVWVLHFLIGWVTEITEGTGNKPLMLGLLSLLLLAYALLMATPFAPGIEIGISLLVLRGADIAPFVYAATVAGLSLAFLAGRYMPYAWLHAIFYDLRLMSACRLLERTAPLDRDQRLELLRGRLPGWLGPLIGGGRYLMLAVLLNLPGNFVVGGGGGLAFLAGLSRLYGSTATLAVMAAAVLPVPLWVWLYGSDILKGG
jgi:hypothetical protein